MAGFARQPKIQFASHPKRRCRKVCDECKLWANCRSSISAQSLFSPLDKASFKLLRIRRVPELRCELLVRKSEAEHFRAVGVDSSANNVASAVVGALALQCILPVRLTRMQRAQHTDPASSSADITRPTTFPSRTRCRSRGPVVAWLLLPNRSTLCSLRRLARPSMLFSQPAFDYAGIWMSL